MSALDSVVLLSGYTEEDELKAAARRPRVTPRRLALGLVLGGGSLTVAGVGLVFIPAALVLAGLALASLGLLALREAQP